MRPEAKTRMFVALSALGVLALLLVVLFIDVLFPPRADIAIPSLGPDQAEMANASAPVVIVEYGDFQCPFCKQVLPTLKRVKAVYGDDVAVVYKHFPLASIHPYAMRAAEASECARDQGRFWEYHDTLFENQGDFADDRLVAYAAGINLDADAFKECLASGIKKAIVQRDFQKGMDEGIQGTPIFFINGRRLEGAQPFSAFKEIIDGELGDG